MLCSMRGPDIQNDPPNCLPTSVLLVLKMPPQPAIGVAGRGHFLGSSGPLVSRKPRPYGPASQRSGRPGHGLYGQSRPQFADDARPHRPHRAGCHRHFGAGTDSGTSHGAQTGQEAGRQSKQEIQTPRGSFAKATASDRGKRIQRQPHQTLPAMLADLPQQ